MVHFLAVFHAVPVTIRYVASRECGEGFLTTEAQRTQRSTDQGIAFSVLLSRALCASVVRFLAVFHAVPVTIRYAASRECGEGFLTTEAQRTQRRNDQGTAFAVFLLRALCASVVRFLAVFHAVPVTIRYVASRECGEGFLTTEAQRTQRRTDQGIAFSVLLLRALCASVARFLAVFHAVPVTIRYAASRECGEGFLTTEAQRTQRRNDQGTAFAVFLLRALCASVPLWFVSLQFSMPSPSSSATPRAAGVVNGGLV